jgi:nickel/cobalt exporter
MAEGILYVLSSFWLGALHAATPGHGKTIAASYIVGARGRPVDALILGIFVTLSHTSGIVLVAALATMGSAWLVPQRVETYLAVGTGVLVIGIGCWMLRMQLSVLSVARARGDSPSDRQAVLAAHAPDPRPDDGGAAAGHGQQAQDRRPGSHSHGWGLVHSHDIEAITQTRPSLALLLGLAIAGGLLPDPGALAILLAAIASGKLVLGLVSVLVFSLGFASVLAVVGVVAARVGHLILTWFSRRWVGWVQIGAAMLIVGVGLVLTASALRGLTPLR